MSLPPFTQLRSLRALRLSPDGRFLAFFALRPSLEMNQNVAELVLLSPDDGRQRVLTVCAGVPDGPVWLDGGRLAYAVGRDVYAVDLDGQVERCARTERPVRQLVRVPGTDLLIGTMAARPPEEDAPFTTATLPYKRDGRGRLHGPDRLVAIAHGGEVTDLGPGMQPVPSPDGGRLAHLVEAQSLEFLDFDLVVRDLSTSGPSLGEPVRQGVSRAPQAFAWSPTGMLAVLAHDQVIGGARPSHVEVGRPGGAYANWTEALALWPGSLEAEAGDWTFSPARLSLDWLDDDTVLVLDQRGGAVEPVAVAATSSRRLATVDGILGDALPDGVGGLYAVLETPTHPHEIVHVEPEGALRVLTDLNPFTLPAPEHFTVPGANGEAVDVYALFARDGPGPTVFAVHGGPHGAFMRGIYLDHHRVRAAGIHVVWANPHGSTGYGHAFAQALVGHWGELDEGEWRTIRARLGEMGRAPTRLGVWGTSYGGYMATWLAGHLEEVACAVIQAPVTNQVSMTGSSDIGYSFTPRGLGFEDPVPSDVEDLDRRVERAWQNSPLRTYPNIQAATLILVGDHDDRCPPSQAEELYTLLRHRNRQPVELVIYPGESHLIARQGKPRSRDDRQRRTVSWLRRHLIGR